MTINFSLLPKVCARTGISRSGLYDRINQGLFPKPISRGKRGVAWCEHEIEAINYARTANKSDSAIRAIVDYLEGVRSNASELANLLSLPLSEFFKAIDEAGVSNKVSQDNNPAR